LYERRLNGEYFVYREVIAVNRHRFHSDMEAAWELRPDTDETPGSYAHRNRFAKPIQQTQNAQNVKTAEKQTVDLKNKENGS
jgi:hypothetical protein